MEIDPERLDIQITQSSEESEGPALYANIRSVSLENNIGEILCCEIIDCRITISNLFLTYLY